MIEAVLNGLSLNQFIGYLIWSIVGGLIGILSEQYKFHKSIKSNGGFSIIVWINENWQRTALGLLCMIVGIIFQEQFTGNAPSNFGALIAGLTIDTMIDRVVNRKK